VRIPRAFNIPAGTTTAAIELKVATITSRQRTRRLNWWSRTCPSLADYVHRISVGQTRTSGITTDDEDAQVSVENFSAMEKDGAQASLNIVLSHRTDADTTVAYSVKQSGPEVVGLEIPNLEVTPAAIWLLRSKFAPPWAS
jgi:hypothetical protein